MILLETNMMISNMVMLMGASTLLVGLVVSLVMMWWSLYLTQLWDYITIGGELRDDMMILVFDTTSGLHYYWSVSMFRAKNSYSIEHRPIDYVPTATLGSCCGRVPCCKSCKLKQSELKLNLWNLLQALKRCSIKSTGSVCNVVLPP
jgi:hypothetical protein